MTAMSKTERWSWEHHPDRPGGRIALSAGGRDVILAAGDGGRSWLEVSDEDARMIEALPELLAACRSALAAMDSLRTYLARDDDPTRELLARILTSGNVPARLGAAVAKATGKAQR
jgi:hypothetical protein